MSDDKVIPIARYRPPRLAAGPEMLTWTCEACDSQAFRLYGDGSISCARCGFDVTGLVTTTTQYTLADPPV